MAYPKPRQWAFVPALGIASAIGLASPALAETTALSCEGELSHSIGNSREPWHTSIDVDLSARQISMPILTFYGGSLWRFTSPVAVTDREISINSKSDPGNGTLTSAVGVIDRLAGTLDLRMILQSNGATDNIGIQAKCRPATQKF
jgi:hypothetical protein